jgi:hypothetical protein
MPQQTIFETLALMPLMFAVFLLFKGLQIVYRGFGDKAKPYKWNEWVSVILIPVTLLAMLIAYQITKIYCLKNYPQMHVWEFWIVTYYVCVYIAVGLPFVSFLATAIIGRKFFGLKVEKFKSDLIFCPKCGEAMTSDFCANCGANLKSVK